MLSIMSLIWSEGPWQVTEGLLVCSRDLEYLVNIEPKVFVLFPHERNSLSYVIYNIVKVISFYVHVIIFIQLAG